MTAAPSERKIRVLLAQHTAATGQAFTEKAQARIGTRTAGQPWLVNALCYDACFRHQPGRDRARPITADAILAAQERLILRRDTLIDDLAHKLREERVRRVVEPIHERHPLDELTPTVDTTPVITVVESGVFQRWLSRLRDYRAVARINARLDQIVAFGHFGDTRAVGRRH